MVEGDEKLFFLFEEMLPKRNWRYKYLISFFMLFKKKWMKAFEMDGKCLWMANEK